MTQFGRAFPSRHVGMFIPSASGPMNGLDADTVNFVITPSGSDQLFATTTLIDTATRTVSNSWGTPDKGPAWAAPDANTTFFDVDGAALTYFPGTVSAQNAIYNAMTSTVVDGEITFDFQATNIANISEAVIDIMLRAGSAYSGTRTGLGVRIDYDNYTVTPGMDVMLFGLLNSSGGAKTLTTVRFSDGTTDFSALWHAKIALSGTRLMAKFWKSGDPEPPNYIYDDPDVTTNLPSQYASAAGGLQIGLGSFASASLSRPQINIDNLNVSSVFTGFQDYNLATYYKITPSATEVRESADSATVLFAITPSAAEGAQFVDSGSIYYDIQAITTSEGRESADAGTVYYDIQASSTDTAQFVDAATVVFAITPSAAETRESADAATVYYDIQTSDAQAFAGVDAATVNFAITPATTFEGREEADAATVLYAITPSAAESAQFVDTGAVYVDIQASSTDVAGFVDSATVAVVITPTTSSETAQFVDAGTVPVALTPSSVDVPVYAESGTVPVKITPSATEQYTPAAQDAATVLYTITPDYTEHFHPTETVTVPFAITPSGVDELPIQDSGIAVMTITPSGTDEIGLETVAIVPYTITPETSAEGDIVYYDITPSAVSAQGWSDDAQVYMTITPSMVEEAQTSTFGTIYYSITPIFFEHAEMADAATVTMFITPSTLFEARKIANYLLVGTLRDKWTSSLDVVTYTGRLHEQSYQIVDFFNRWGVVWHGRGDE